MYKTSVRSLMLCMIALCGIDSLNFFTEASRAAEKDDQPINATSYQPRHPILIGKSDCPLTRITITVEPELQLRLKSIEFDLNGTDDIHDLKSVTLYATGENDEFATSAIASATQTPAEHVVFPIDVQLKPGKHVYWLATTLNRTADLNHRISANARTLTSTIGSLSITPTTSPSPHRIGVAVRQQFDDGVHTYRIPALTTSARGTLLLVYDMRRRKGRDLQEDIDIGLSRSTDGGLTWEPVRVIMDMGEYGGLPQELNGCSDPGIIVDRQTGEIFCFAVWMNGKEGKHQWNGDGSEPGFEIGKSAQFMMVRSQDDGKTWSPPENLTRTLKKEEWWLFAPSPQQGIQLEDGTLIMPAQGRDAHGKEFSTIMNSSDHGKTWVVGTPAYIGGSECQAVKLSDGRLMLNMRNENERFRAVFTTPDLGVTWTPHESDRKSLFDPNCNGSLLRVDYFEQGTKKNLLLFSNPHTQKGRTHQTIQVSFDEGRTWPESFHTLLDEGRGAGYPSLTQIDQDRIGIVYEGSQAHLVFEKFSIAELIKVR